MHGTGLSRTAGPSSSPVQPTLDDIGTPLSAVTFVVVDLETTGGSPTAAAITEIGAVKVRGGEVLGEFQTLVDPGGPVPAFIAALTGITSSMVRGQPRIEQVLPAFFEFSRGAVLVAHSAPFDIGFLKAAARDQGYPWPVNQVLDTVALARRAVTRDEVPNHKLSTLAAFFRTAVAPEHRALSDARATVDVLHACLARLGPLGITHLEDLATATDPVLGCDGGAEEGREGGQLVVGDLVAGHRPAGQCDGVEHLVPRPRVALVPGGRLEEADVERGVVRHQDGATGELEECGQHLLDPRLPADHRAGDPGQGGDERRHRPTRVHEGLELAEHLTAPHLHRADLG